MRELCPSTDESAEQKWREASTRLVGTLSRQVDIIVVASIDRFRRLARELPTSQDAVLEIGSSTGMTTRLLARSAGRVLAVDVASQLVERLQSEVAGIENVSVARIDGRHTPDLAALMPEPDLIFIDIGGNALLDNVAFQIRQCLRAFAPRLLVVRSLELAALCSLIRDFETCDSSGLHPRPRSNRFELVIESLLDLSRSTNVRNRAFAARRLSQVNAPAARERLHEMATDPDHRVRRIVQSRRGQGALAQDVAAGEG